MLNQSVASPAAAHYQTVAQRVASALREAGVIPDDQKAPAQVARNAQVVLDRRYLKKDDNGQPAEHHADMYWRVATNLAAEDARYGATPEQVAETRDKFYALMISNRSLPNSPTLMNAGRELQQLSACFVLPVPDTLDGIFMAVHDTAMIHKSGGGTGFDFSDLRPAGDPVGSTNGVASGPVTFIDAFDSATDVVKQGGTRRGANMGILRIDHTDIIEFIRRKEDPAKLQNFNVSVAATDAFMQATLDNADYELVNPRTRKVVGKLNAGEVFNLIVANAWKTGDPGLIFVDAINRDNPNPHVNTIASTNPCVTSDTVVATSDGPRTAADLVGQQFNALINGEAWPSTAQGFFHTGYRQVLSLHTDAGHRLKLTPDHKVRIRTKNGDSWTNAEDVMPGNLIVLNHTPLLPASTSVRQHFQILANTRGAAVAEAEITDTDANPVAVVTAIDPAGHADVYDCQVPGINAFDANGIYVHQCGEQPMGPNEACNLASVNMNRMVKYDADTGTFVMDYELLRETVFDTVHLLDNVIDANRWPLPEIEAQSLASRRIGLGVMGFADLLIILGIPYHSEQALRTAEFLMRKIQEYAWLASQELAERRGAYPNYAGSKYERQQIPPMRNTAPVTIAPTGTISIIAGASSGIEPLFALAYQRNVMDNTVLTEFHAMFEAVAERHGFNTPELMGHVQQHGDLEHPDAPEWARELFAVSHQIPPLHHVAIQAAFQKHTDNAVSKTINMPSISTETDIRQAYRQAWESGCKGITVYRDGSKAQQVLSTQSSGEVNERAELVKKPRPRVVKGETIRINTAHGTCYVTVNSDPDEPNLPFEVFASMGKAGSCDSAHIEAICRLASTAFRAGVSNQEIIDQLDGINCHPFWDGGQMIRSIPDAIANALDVFMKQESETTNPVATQNPLPMEIYPNGLPVPTCPDCGKPTQMAEGCETCYHCGWSQCEENMG